MSDDLHGPTRSITTTFCKKLRRRVTMLVVFSVVAFGFVLDRVLRDDLRQSQLEHARLCAAALVPGPDGDLSQSANLLVERSPQVIAIATLNAAGQLRSVYPERPAHREAANELLSNPLAIVTMTNALGRDPIQVTAADISWNGSNAPSARRLLIMMQADSYVERWLATTGVFTLLVTLLATVTFRSMRQWFEGSVSRPLRHMVQAVRNPDLHHGPSDRPTPRRRRETSEIARLFDELIDGMARSEARVQEVEREMLHKIREHQQGFDRELRRARDKATIDELTGLRNRAFLASMLEPLHAMQIKRNADLAVVMIDMDNFKLYNDTHGHLVGDALLRFVGSLLKSAVRPQDHAVRFGGDEFLLLLPDTNAADASIVTERIVKLFKQYVSRLGPEQKLSMSAGIATLDAEKSETGKDLVQLADTALYVAKRNGKNGVFVSQAA